MSHGSIDANHDDKKKQLIDVDGNIKRGWLDKDFRFFHLKDQKKQEFESHYHDFDKIIIFLSGKVDYVVEGKTYKLKPWDVLLVRHHAIHRPIIDSLVPYERIIIWIHPGFIAAHSTEEADLTACFRPSDQRSLSLVRVQSDSLMDLRRLLSELEAGVSSTEFAAPLLSNALFIELLIRLNRLVLSGQNAASASSYASNRRVDEILQYINHNLGQDLSIETLSRRFFCSRSYLMHCFRKETGYTVHNYILQKRLLFATELIQAGIPITEACFRCGFQDFSTFSRAYRKLFGSSPRSFNEART